MVNDADSAAEPSPKKPRGLVELLRPVKLPKLRELPNLPELLQGPAPGERLLEQLQRSDELARLAWDEGVKQTLKDVRDLLLERPEPLWVREQMPLRLKDQMEDKQQRQRLDELEWLQEQLEEELQGKPATAGLDELLELRAWLEKQLREQRRQLQELQERMARELREATEQSERERKAGRSASSCSGDGCCRGDDSGEAAGEP